jgi:glutathione S-transferase
MPERRLVIGNRNHSSWSLRAWLALAQTGLAFETTVIPLDRPDTADAIRRYSPTGRVPVLLDGDSTVWDSLAIGEYLAEEAPGAGLWPAGRAARAVARSVVAEMHSGFGALRTQMLMNIRGRTPRTPDAAGQRELDRLLALWRDARTRFGEGGPFLFGAFTLADAFAAPWAFRARTYALELPADIEAYVAALLDHPPMRAWRDAALAEPWTVDLARYGLPPGDGAPSGPA